MALSLGQRLWTREEYHKMGEAGVFAPGERVELIEGQIVPMSPRDPLDDNCISTGTTVFIALFGESHAVRVQLTLSLGERSDPEPDFVLISREEASRLARKRLHPDAADLIVEVSRTSLAYDRGVKASLYAREGVPEYWIVNLVDFCLEVYRQPRAEAEAPYGWNYAERVVLGRDGRIAPLFSQKEVKVSELLPP